MQRDAPRRTVCVRKGWVAPQTEWGGGHPRVKRFVAAPEGCLGSTSCLLTRYLSASLHARTSCASVPAPRTPLSYLYQVFALEQPRCREPCVSTQRSVFVCGSDACAAHNGYCAGKHQILRVSASRCCCGGGAPHTCLAASAPATPIFSSSYFSANSSITSALVCASA